MADDGSQLFEELMRFKPDGVTPNAWAVRAGVSRTIWSDLRRHGNPSRRTLSKLLEAAGSSLAEFEALRIGAPANGAPDAARLADGRQAWGPASLAPLPLIWTGPGGTWGEPASGIQRISIERDKIVDRLPRPASLANDSGAYAIGVVNEGMWPRFRNGRKVAVSPLTPARVGDDVLLLTASGTDALLGELQRQTAEAVGLRQFNPPAEFDVPAADVTAIHRVPGELI